MTSEERKSLDQLFAEDATLLQELQDSGGRRGYSTGLEAVVELLRSRIAFLKREIADMRASAQQAKWGARRHESSTPPIVLRPPGGDTPP